MIESLSNKKGALDSYGRVSAKKEVSSTGRSELSSFAHQIKENTNRQLFLQNCQTKN